MNRRDFLKFSPFVFSPLFRCDKALQTFDIVSAFANVQDGDVLNIPPGNYEVSNELSLLNRDSVIVNWNNALIFPYWNYPANKPVLNMQGAKNCTINNLRIHSHLNNALPVTGILSGRSESSHGGGNTFNSPRISGNYTGAGIYNVSAEGNRFVNGDFQTENDNPMVIISDEDILGLGLVESSCCLHYFDRCNFRNYGTSTVSIFANGTVSELKITDSFAFVGTDAVFLQSNADIGGFSLRNIRAEGNGNCALYENTNNMMVYVDVHGITWTLQSSMLRGMMYV